jgi:hypothetical protein
MKLPKSVPMIMVFLMFPAAALFALGMWFGSLW